MVESPDDRCSGSGRRYAAGPGPVAVTQDTLKLIGGAELVLTPGDPRILVGGRRAILRPKELELLKMLVREPGRLIKSAVLAKQLAHGHRPLSKTTVAVHIHRLRIRLEPVGLTIRSFRGAGYTLEALGADQVDKVR